MLNWNVMVFVSKTNKNSELLSVNAMSGSAFQISPVQSVLDNNLQVVSHRYHD